MDLKQIRYFARVAELGSFSKAAELLDIAQPTLSRHVRALEVELRTNLFHRHGRGVVLTAGGRRFLDHCYGLLQAADAALHALQGSSHDLEGRIVGGFTPTVGKIVIPALVPSFLREFPKASFSIVEGLSSALHDQLLVGRLDFAVVHNPPASVHLVIEPITTESLYLVGSSAAGDAADAVALSDLAGLPLILPGAPHAVRGLIESEAARLGIRLWVKVEIDAPSSIFDLVAAGHGYAVVPMNARRSSGSSLGLSWQRIDGAGLSTTLCMVTPVRSPHSQVLAREAARVARDVVVGILADKSFLNLR